MSSLSPIQTLPLHIVRRIVHHVAGCSRLQLDGAGYDHQKRPELLMPLLWVCRNLRDVVYSLYNQQFEIQFYSEHSGELSGSWPSWPRCLQMISRPSTNLATTLTMVADTHLIYSGEALDTMLEYSLHNCTFPKVRSLVCSFTWSPPGWESPNPEDVEANICAFVDYIKQLVPLVNDVSIFSNQSDDMEHLDDDFFGETDILCEDKYFGDLASHLYQLANRISYTCDGPFELFELQPDLIRNLVSLECESDIEAINNIVHVVRQNAQTLQKLTLAFQLQINIADLVQSPGGGYVKYPCLSTLSLDLNTWSTFTPLSVDRRVVLFPSLRSLNLSYDYPFDDDVLFRGNSATLEYLRVMPGRGFCDVVRKYNVFTPTSHPKLQWVESVRLPYDRESQFTSTEAHLQFMLNIAPNAVVKVIPAIPAGEETFLALDLLKDHACMQVLELRDTQLMLWEVVLVVKSLPLLSDLVCKSTGLGTYFKDVTLDTLPVYVRDIQVPLRERFRCWRLGDVDSDSLEETLICILVVAMTFPNFNYANLPNPVLHEYMELMEDTLESDEYTDVAPRLERLLFDKTI